MFDLYIVSLLDTLFHHAIVRAVALLRLPVDVHKATPEAKVFRSMMEASIH